MSRHTRRCWRRTATATALAIALGAEAAQVATQALTNRGGVSGGELAAAVGLAYASVVALCGAVAWAVATGRAAARDGWQRRQTPTTGRPAMTAEAIVEHRARAQAEEDAHAEAMAAVAADAPLPERTQTPHDGDTAVMPPVASVLGAWDYAPAGRHVADAQPWPWTPMAEARRVAAYAMGESGATGRHAGRWAA